MLNIYAGTKKGRFHPPWIKPEIHYFVTGAEHAMGSDSLDYFKDQLERFFGGRELVNEVPQMPDHLHLREFIARDALRIIKTEDYAFRKLGHGEVERLSSDKYRIKQ